MKNKIAVCIGTRPEAIKMAPLILALRDSNYEVSVCSTGQHAQMVNPVLNFFDIRTDIDFQLMDRANNILDLMSLVTKKMDCYLDEFCPSLVLSQGDTTSALACGIASYYKKIPFGHIEAGLRTGDKYSPWPEEGNRRMLSTIATYHFAPTQRSRENLLKEGVPNEDIYVTGNTVIDALYIASSKLDRETIIVPGFCIGTENQKIILITGHRRENFGKKFDAIFGGIAELAKKFPDVQFVFPVHLNPLVRAQVASHLRPLKLNNLFLIEPVGYPEFVYLMEKAYFILTDSGGIQEEAPALGKPVLVMRDVTERPEGIEAGVVKLIGTLREQIIANCSELLLNEEAYNKMATAKNPYGNGTASKQIVQIIQKNI